MTRTGRSMFLTYLPPCCETVPLMAVRRSRSSTPETHKIIPEKAGRRCSSTFYGKVNNGERRNIGSGPNRVKVKVVASLPDLKSVENPRWL